MSHVTTRRALLAVSALLLAACQDAAQPTAPQPGAPLGAMSPVAQDRVEALFRRASPEVLALPGTVFADNDERIDKVVVGIEHMGAARAVEQAFERLGIAKADYEIEMTEPIHFAATLRDSFRPVIAGVQIHFTRYVCTIGFNANFGTTRAFITNSHCTATQGGTEGTVYYQPSSSTSEVIATEVADPAYVKGGSCPKGKKCRWSDASRANYSSTQSALGRIARTTGFNNGSLTVDAANPTFSVTGEDDVTTNFAVGTVVNKVGRTTGWTRGSVTRSCVDTGVSGSTVMLYCQTFVTGLDGAIAVGGGDSGSGVWSESGGGARIVGLLWGGNSSGTQFVFSPLASVKRELGNFAVR